MRTRIRLDTMSSINKFVEVVSRAECDVKLEDGTGYCVSALSILGCLASMEWNEIYCCCEKDISGHIVPWII